MTYLEIIIAIHRNIAAANGLSISAIANDITTF